MGVQGLWHLLQPCARPTKLESLEGRRLAIDSSIWLYHFQMAMRDKEGRTLSNAHILGFLWRILKLIHYGIRPIFVFDGGAPVMKRKTLVGRRQRKAGAKDDHRRIAERLLNARLREAAVSHVATTSGAAASKGVDANEESHDDVAGAESENHGLGQNTVYFDDLAGAGPSSAVQQATDDGALSPTKAREAQDETGQRKKKNDWHKDPYALPSLERDINTLTATNSTAAKSARGGGKRQDVRFATEGELRALLSSIGPTDLDLDSEFFRSLPSELQYELVGDMRAASRGTSYKRLQSMLSQSPTPIDFSRAQIAGLKTRNELTQKVLEVTDEIGDAHIKVPIRVAGARNREYVLVRNNGNQGGFALGVRESGTTQEKAIRLDEETASTIGTDEEGRLTDEEVDLEEVAIVPSPAKAAGHKDRLPDELLKANPNDPEARKEVARELLQRRARALAKEKAREQGVSDEAEEMEEQLRKAREASVVSRQGNGSAAGSKAKGDLFRRKSTDQSQRAAIELDASEEEDEEEEEEWEQMMDQHEAADLARALDESQRTPDEVGEEGEEEMELEEVQTHAFEADDYSTFYRSDVAIGHSGENDDEEKHSGITAAPQAQSVEHSGVGRKASTTSGPALGFRMQDRTGQPGRLDPRLLAKRRFEDESEEEIPDLSPVPSTTPPPLSPVQPPTKHARVISISDSDASHAGGRKEVGSPPRSTSSSVALHSEQDTDEGVKAVDFGTRAVDDNGADRVVRPVSLSDVESTREQSQSKSPSLTRLAPDSNFSPLSPSPNASSESETLSVAARDAPRFEQQETPSADGASTAREPSSPTNVTREPSPVEVARRVGISRSHTPASMAAEEDLREETGEVVEYDNLGSMADEVGQYPQMELGPVQDEHRDSEDEHSDYSNQEHGGRSTDGSQSPTPPREVALGPDGFPLPTTEELAAMDAEDEAELGEMANDQDEFVSFLSRAKGQGLNEVRKEVEAEVNRLRSDHATTRRTEGEVTQQMAKEIQFMLRLFGLPYITAPMEAEAQCAELISLKLADGIITDDSDVFLFGGTFIYKNMFNNKKYVECYKLSDLQHNLSMDRTKLVQLAYLLGSDYTEGLEGVGPVLAMEILSHFPGDDGLVNFREWWLKVQTGKDTVEDTYDSTLKRVKRTLRNKVHLESHWPDPNVIDAYFEPTVDSSKETFQWGLPDLDSLRSFFSEYLRWDKEKTDHYLIPAIEAQNRRSRRPGAQSTLDRGNFFDLGAGEGAYAGRQRPGYNSSRLQQVIENFRASNASKEGKRAGRAGRAGRGDGSEIDPVGLSEDEEEEGQGDSVSEELVGKAMGKESRPVVQRRKGTKERQGEEGEEGAEAAGGSAKRTRRQKRKASNEGDGEGIEDREWRPAKAKAKRQAQAKQAPSRGATTLSQARNMSLDSVANLPPSRGERRAERTSRASQRAIVLSDGGDESSSLSEE